VYSPNAFEGVKVFKKREKCMEVKHDIEISPKLCNFTPEKAYNHEVWIFIYRFMHNMLDLFVKALINLQKQQQSFR
jgi:hypothetical protein